MYDLNRTMKKWTQTQKQKQQKNVMKTKQWNKVKRKHKKEWYIVKKVSAVNYPYQIIIIITYLLSMFICSTGYVKNHLFFCFCFLWFGNSEGFINQKLKKKKKGREEEHEKKSTRKVLKKNETFHFNTIDDEHKHFWHRKLFGHH